MYIAAFEISRKQCDAGELIDDIRPIQNPETILPCTDEDRPCYYGYEKSRYVKRQYTEREDGTPEYLYYKKEDLILVELPPSLELLCKVVSKLTPEDTLFKQLKELSER